MTVGTIIGIGSVAESGSGKSSGRFCEGVGLGIMVGMTDGAQGIAHYKILAMDFIPLVVVYP